MAETSEVTPAPLSLTALGDDPLRAALSFLSVAECRRSVGATAKQFRALATSTRLARARFSDHYVLRGDTHGVVHFLATAGGTRAWPNRYIQAESVQPAPPATLRITERRRRVGDLQDPNPLQRTYFAAAVVSPVDPGSGLASRHFLGARGHECCMQPGCFVEYHLPFELRISHFRIGFGNCYARNFRYWVFEAFDDQLSDWRVLYNADGVSPWPHNPITDLIWGAHTLFRVGPPFPSSRFRIRLTSFDMTRDESCMHIRGFELFGAILPPWRIDE